MPSRPAPSPPRRARPLRVALASLVVLVAAAELVLHAFVIRDGTFRGKPLPPYGAITHPGRQRQFLEHVQLAPEERGSIGCFDAELGWTHLPDAETSGGGPAARATTNSIGARGRREYAPTPPAGVTRIACFGDSFTWCEEVGDDRTWEAIYERRYRDAEVINLGVGGYGTDQALLRFRRLGKELSADVVCIGILLENIGRNVNRYRPLWSLSTWMTRAKPRFVLGDGGLELVPQPFATEQELVASVLDGSVVERLREHEHWWGPCVPTGRASALLRLALGYRAFAERQPRRLWLDVDGEPFRVTLALLETFHAEALAAGARLAPVLVFPDRNDLAGYVERDDRYWSTLLDALEARGIPYLDLAPVLAPFQREATAMGRPGLPFAGYHLSRGSNSRVADALHALLDERLD